MAKLSPIESEFATTEEAEAYDVWFRAKVQEALDSTEPDVPHDVVMAGARAIIEKHKADAARLAR
ncbi:type II toxin-antitoxin system RelB family antitoxin [Sphingomonas glacialis]|uniref:Stability determinant n=1 Tax=Sphingomonas glacialis TaxID=658225 RepID=A0A502FYM6_9SPHN|nr:stability determinant [Sphingomonas glacialis]TPG54638.1 stability determinant [Sphingomonas glacialis]